MKSAVLIVALILPRVSLAEDETPTFQFAGKEFHLAKVDVYSNRCILDYYTSPAPTLPWDEMLSLTALWDLNPVEAKKYFEHGHKPESPLLVRKNDQITTDARNGDQVVDFVTKPVNRYVSDQGEQKFPWLYWNYGRMHITSGGLRILDYTYADRTGKIERSAFEAKTRKDLLPKISDDFSVLERFLAGPEPRDFAPIRLAYSDNKLRYAQLELTTDGAIFVTLIEPHGGKPYTVHRRLGGVWIRSEHYLNLELALWPDHNRTNDIGEMTSRTASQLSLPYPMGPAGEKGQSETKNTWHISLIDEVPKENAAPVLLVAHAPVLPEKPVLQHDAQVEISLHVEADGTVSSSTVKKSTDPLAEKETVKATAQWRFLPKRKDGKSVPFDITIPLKIQAVGK